MNNYPFYNNMYMPEMQMRQPQQNQSTPHIQQTFQLSNPQNNVVDFDGKYAKDIEEVKNNLIFKNTIYIDKENVYNVGKEYKWKYKSLYFN